MLVVMVSVIITAVSFFTQNNNDDGEFSYGDLIELFEADLVKSYEVDGDLVMNLVAFVPELDANKEIKLENGKGVIKLDDKGKSLPKNTNISLATTSSLHR